MLLKLHNNFEILNYEGFLMKRASKNIKFVLIMTSTSAWQPFLLEHGGIYTQSMTL
jgi:hypothetical protein